MIDPTKVTKYNQTQNELQEFILFWVCASGKNGKTAARCLDQFLKKWKIYGPSPFDIVLNVAASYHLASELKAHGIGCYNAKSQTFLELATSKLNLQKCSVEDLEQIQGIGPKTARCFVIHSRQNQSYAGLDTHCLKFLRDLGYAVPKSTPTGKKYKELENIFLSLCQIAKMTVPVLDLIIWNYYSGNDGDSKKLLSIFPNLTLLC